MERDQEPVTPHAAPIVNEDGALTYVGDDGRRYVVGLPPETDAAGVERLMDRLQRGSPLFDRIEALCDQWLRTVSSDGLEPRAALVLLLTTLETALEARDPDNRSEP